MERILWAKGLQQILGLEASIVATTDSRPIVKTYGLEHDVLVLDGSFLTRLANRKNGTPSERLSEEDLLAFIGEAKDDKLLGNWRGRLQAARARLLSKLEFDGCNAWLEDARYFIEQSLVSGRDEAACRLAYLMVSYFLIGLDFSLRTLAFEDADVRRRAFVEGFRYGSRGRVRIEEAVSTAEKMLIAFQPESKAAGRNFRTQALSGLESMPVDVLGDFFSRSESAKELFSWARLFESRAYARGTRPAR
jgi:hypothetical protein